jgi:hypothetical protein
LRTKKKKKDKDAFEIIEAPKSNKFKRTGDLNKYPNDEQNLLLKEIDKLSYQNFLFHCNGIPKPDYILLNHIISTYQLYGAYNSPSRQYQLAKTYKLERRFEYCHFINQL